MVSKTEKYLSKLLKEAINKLEELEQDKLYFIHMKDAKAEDLGELKRMFNLLKTQVKWTIPNIVISNKPIQELSLGELQALVEQKKRLVDK